MVARVATNVLPVLSLLSLKNTQKRAAIRKQRALERRRSYLRRRCRSFLLLLLNIITILVQQLPVRQVWCKPRSSSFWDTINNDWGQREWLENLRMSQQSFERLCTELAPFIERQDTNFRRRAIPARERVAIALYRLSDTVCYRTISNLFGIGKSTACTITTQVCRAILEVMFKKYVRLPIEDEVEDEMDGFFDIAGLPQVVGAVDGCHIPIMAPKNNKEDYVNRKKFYSIILQGLVDSDYFLRDVCIGWPGKVHDARVFKNSVLYDACSSRSFLPLNLSKRVSGVVVPPLIIGDSAYGLKNWLMRPYYDRGNLTPSQVAFNTALSKTRAVVENAFGRLKGRFRCLGKRLDLSVANCCVTVGACCVLHNFCESMKEQFNDDWLTGVQIYAGIPNYNRNDAQNQQAEAIRDALKDFIA